MLKILDKFLKDYHRLDAFLTSLNLKIVHLFIPALMALLASCFEGASIALLVPTMKGLMEADFQFAIQNRMIGPVLEAFPEIFTGRNSAVFAVLVAVIFAAAILKNVSLYVSTALVARQVRFLSYALREKLFDCYMRFSKSYFDKASSGHLHQILIGYTEQVAGQFFVFNQTLFSFFSFCIYWALMCAISWKATLFVLLVFPLLHFMFKSLIEKIQKDSMKFSESFSEMGKKISNALGCLPFIKAISAEEHERKWFSHISKNVRDVQVRMDRKNLLIGPVQDIFTLMVVVVLVAFMAYLIVRLKEGDLSRFFVFFLLLRRSFANMGAFSSMQAALATVRGPMREITKIFEDHKQFNERDGAVEFDFLKKSVRLHDLSFSYGDKLVLDCVQLDIPKGKMTAIVGKTGSGKSTLINLLMRFYKSPRGSIFFDDTDIHEFRIKSLRSKIAYVSQETYLFDATIEVNLNYGLTIKASSTQLMEAIEKAQLSDLISKLPKGLDTEIGERGIQLSGGEKQRMSIARAFLRAPEILILDEATSALDSQTEELVQKAISGLVNGKTSVVIAHRLSTIKMADQIIVIESGKIVEKGSFADLLNAKGLFSDMWSRQFFHS